jgi:5-formyltetrahydrofolate cyclo-ligase
MTIVNLSSKSFLRKQLRVSRERIPEASRAIFSRVITERLIETTDWTRIQRLHCYIPIHRWSEVDTWEVVRYIWREWPNIEIAVPGPLIANHPTTYAIDKRTTWLDDGAVPYPVEKHPIIDTVFDLIVVPCLGFDDQRYRLGYGSGYYDRFLSTQPQAMTIGVAFWATYVADGLPHEEHDIPLGRIITEESML